LKDKAKDTAADISERSQKTIDKVTGQEPSLKEQLYNKGKEWRKQIEEDQEGYVAHKEHGIHTHSKERSDMDWIMIVTFVK
jgi:hypothetical protein